MRLFQDVMAQRTEVLGWDHPDTLRSRSSLANSYYAVGSYKRAVDMHQETLAARRRVLGLDDERTQASQARLAEARQAAMAGEAGQTT
jgi:hypothetical protein